MYLFTSSKVEDDKINRQSTSQARFTSTLFHFHPFAFARVLSQSASLTSTLLLRERTRATLTSTSWCCTVLNDHCIRNDRVKRDRRAIKVWNIVS